MQAASTSVYIRYLLLKTRHTAKTIAEQTLIGIRGIEIFGRRSLLAKTSGRAGARSS